MPVTKSAKLALRLGEKAHFECTSPVEPGFMVRSADDEKVAAVSIEGGSKGRSGWITAKSPGRTGLGFQCGELGVCGIDIFVIGPDDKWPSMGPERIEYAEESGTDDASIEAAALLRIQVSFPIRDTTPVNTEFQTMVGTGGRGKE